MLGRMTTVAFEGVEGRLIDVQVQLSTAGGKFFLVGLPDKAVAESKERVTAALCSLGLGLPAKKIVVNLAPADLPKEGSHYDLAIALALLAAMGIAPQDALDGWCAIGELALDGTIAPVVGALPAAMAAEGAGLGLYCPEANGAEAAWSGGHVMAARSLIGILNHMRGSQVMRAAERGALLDADDARAPDLRDVKGQERAKRALEIAAAGGHNLLMVGPPGAGKSMLAQRLPGLLPPLDAKELLEVSMIQSLAGLVRRGSLTRRRPFRAPHHSASMAALVGGGVRAKPGEISLAHHGVLFLDELPEFQPQVLDSLRQPLETGDVVVARANRHVSYPARLQLVAAMNPCRCGGQAGADGIACRRGPRCAADYQARVSGPLLDRMDMRLEVPAVTPADLMLPSPVEGTKEAAARVAAARTAQTDRWGGGVNARVRDADLDALGGFSSEAMAILSRASEKFALTARGFRRVQRVARTIADLEGEPHVARRHMAEALSYRRSEAPSAPAAARGSRTLNDESLALR